MERHFDEELKQLKQKLLQMGDTAQEMIGLAVKALTDRRPAFGEEVLRLEEKVNHWEVEIENEALRLLAIRQPAASDLRLLTAVLKIIGDLERVADQAVNVAETVTYLLKEPPLKTAADIQGMAQLAQRMVKRSLDAFVHHDPILAKAVCEDDDQVDQLNDRIFQGLLEQMRSDSSSITRAVDLILVSKNLERMADHATNIAEDVIFIEQGKNIKHHIQDEPPGRA